MPDMDWDVWISTLPWMQLIDILICLQDLPEFPAQNLTRLKMLELSQCYRYNSSRPPKIISAWQAEKLQALTLDISRKNSAYVSQFKCPQLTYLKLHNYDIYSAGRIEAIASVNHFLQLKKLRLHRFPLWDRKGLLEPFRELSR